MTNRRYRLKKELPTFKIGDEFFVSKASGNLCLASEPWIVAYPKKTLEQFPNILRDWFECIKPRKELALPGQVKTALQHWLDANEITIKSITISGTGKPDSDGYYEYIAYGYVGTSHNNRASINCEFRLGAPLKGRHFGRNNYTDFPVEDYELRRKR